MSALCVAVSDKNLRLENSKMIATIHDRLIAWGKWAANPEVRKVGYPSHSAGFGDYCPPGVEYKSRVPIGYGSADDMQEINAAVLDLPPTDRSFCAEFYVIGGGWDAVCSRLSVSKSVLYRELHRVHERISMRLCCGA